MGDSIKIFSSLLILLFSGIAYGGGQSVPPSNGVSNQVIGPYGTLNNFDSSIIIPSTNAQDLLNVDISPGGASIKKRPGYGAAFTLSDTASAVHGIYRFYDGSGNKVFLFFNGTNVTSSANGNSATTITTGPSAATYQCVDYAGFAYCANTSRTNILKTDGVTATALTGLVSTGTMVAVTPDRLIEAGFSEAPNRIDFSASALFTSWAQPFLLSTDPNEITITAPGSKITHIVYAFQRLMWFKDSSFGYVLFDNTSLSNWQVRTISSNIGTLDNSSIYWQDVLYFRGQDGHFYSFDGATVQRMSREITPLIAQSQTKRNNSWTQSSQADFTAGSLDHTYYGDITTTPGSVALTFPDNFSNYRNGAGGTKGVWTTYLSSGVFGVSTFTASAVGGNLQLTISSGTLDKVWARTELLGDFQQGTTYHLLVNSMPVDSTGVSRFYIAFSSIALNNSIQSTDPTSSSNYWFYFFESTISSSKTWLANWGNSQSDTIGISSAGISIPFTFDLWIATTTFNLSINGTSIKSGTHTWPHNQIAAYFGCMQGGVSVPIGTCTATNFSFAPEQTTFQSQVDHATSLTSWDSFQANSANNGGTNSFYIRASTSSFLVNDALPSWTAITSGQTPTISTGSYLQIRDDLVALSTSATPQLNDFTQNWFEGSAVDKAYAQYFDYGLWWAVQTSTATSNNYVLKYDLLNQGWLAYDIPINGMFVDNNSLYFGSSNSGKIFKYGSVNNDNGNAINAYWKSKDFFGDSPFTQKSISEVSLGATSVINSTITLTLTVDNLYSISDSWYLYNPNSNFIKYINSQPLTSIGTTFNFKIGNNAADQPFEVFAEQVTYTPKPSKNTKQ